MRILFLIENLNAASGGPPRDVLACSKWLARDHQCDITIATRRETKPSLSIPKNIKLSYLCGPRNHPGACLKATTRLKHLLEEHDCLIVNGLWGFLDGFVLRWINWSDRPIYIRTIGMLEEYILNRNKKKKQLARKLYVDHNLLHATGLIVSTRYEEKQIRKLGFDTPISLLPNGVPLENFELPTRKAAQAKLGFNSSEFIILYLGRIHPKKGMHLLLQAFSGLSRKIKAARLVVVGSFYNQQYSKTILSLVQSLNLHDRVTFLGELNDRNKLFAFAVANLFVLPSFSEGFSNAVLEAMACRLPVLITHGCNFPQVALRKAGVITFPDAQAIESSLEQMIQNPDLADMGERGRMMIEEKYNWRSLSAELYSMIQKQVALLTNYS